MGYNVKLAIGCFERARKKMGVTLSDVANAIGMSEGYFRQKYKEAISIKYAVGIAGFLDVDLDDIIERRQEKDINKAIRHAWKMAKEEPEKADEYNQIAEWLEELAELRSYI